MSNDRIVKKTYTSKRYRDNVKVLEDNVFIVLAKKSVRFLPL